MQAAPSRVSNETFFDYKMLHYGWKAITTNGTGVLDNINNRVFKLPRLANFNSHKNLTFIWKFYDKVLKRSQNMTNWADYIKYRPNKRSTSHRSKIDFKIISMVSKGLNCPDVR